ncbi:MAG: restriction endonuclease subunit S, partial [Euryarchaeota archaeon]|nr:restriction endonuclease subunit S [Euryarchaeota archaeon]
MNEDTLLELPKGWIWAKLEDLVLEPKNDIVDGPFGSNLKASEYEDKGIPIIRLQNVTRNKFIKKNIRFIKPEKAELLKRHSFSKNDIVITKLGAPLGEACLVPEDFEWGVIVADIVRVKTDDKYISKKYLVYCINSEVVIKQFETNTKGTTRPRVNLSHIRELELPISPLPEQHRIVTKIEELFTKLDVGVEVLKKTKVQLKL